MKAVDFLITQSCKLGNSILDWIRSIYFSLVGSALLNFALKLFGFDVSAIGAFILAITLLVVGLLYSVKITKRFRDYEKSWLVDVSDRKKKPLEDYCKEHESEHFGWQHLLLYSVWLPAIICIGFVSFRTEKRPEPTNSPEKEQVELLKSEINDLKSIKEQLRATKSDLESTLKRAQSEVKSSNTDESGPTPPIKNRR